jgi:hypothetical protein
MLQIDRGSLVGNKAKMRSFRIRKARITILGKPQISTYWLDLLRFRAGVLNYRRFGGDRLVCGFPTKKTVEEFLHQSRFVVSILRPRSRGNLGIPIPKLVK